MIDHDTQMEIDITENGTSMDVKEYADIETCTESKEFNEQQSQTNILVSLNQETQTSLHCKESSTMTEAQEHIPLRSALIHELEI